MNLSDAIQIIHASPDSLQVYFPPRYAGGIVYLVLGVTVAALAFKFHHTKSTLVFFGVMGLFFVFGGLDLCTYHGSVTFSARTQTCSYREKTFYYTTAKTFPLSSFEQAILKAGSTQNRKVVLLVSSQPELPLGDGYNSRDNQDRAVHAMNAFVAQNVQR